MDRSKLTERQFEIQARVLEPDTPIDEKWVEGYAARFDSPTVLFEKGGIEYKEQIARSAFANAKMDDCFMNYNHQGKVMARTRNKTLQLFADEQGLFIRARLDGTEEGRKLYEEIRGGYIDKMSFAFSIAEESFDRNEHMWTVQRIKRLYDVSAVSIPAYNDTSISARMADAEADARERQQELDNSLTRMRLELKLKLN